MAQKSIKKNYVYNLVYQILTIVTPFITAPYLSRVLGAEGVGSVSFADSIVAYFTLFATMGIATYGQREISYVRDDIESRSVVFWNAKVLEIVTSLMAFVVYLIFAINQGNQALYLVLSMNILAKMTDVTWFFQGMEEFGKIVLRNIVVRIFQIVYVFIFIKGPEDTTLYAAGLAGFTLLSNVSLWSYLPKYIKKVSRGKLRPFRNMGVVLSLFIPTIAIQIYTVLDKTMIGVITHSAVENGYYEQAIKISRMTLHVVTALGTVMVPRIGFLFSNQRHEEVKSYMYRGYRFVWFLGIPLCLGLVMCSDNFVPWFFGPGYGHVSLLLKILALLILAVGINNVTGIQYLIPTRRQNTFTFTVIIGAAVNFTLNSIFIRYFLSAGAAFASVIAETVIAVVQIIIVRRELSPAEIIKAGWHYYIAGATMVIALLPLKNALTPSVIHTGIMVVCGALVYFAVLLVLRDVFFIQNVRKMSAKIMRRHVR